MINKESAFKQTPLKKIIFLFLSFMLIVSISWLSFSANIFGETSDEVKITAESALVIDFETGNILYEKNSNKKIFPASTTKMLTAIVAIENISDYSEVVKISKNASGRNHSAFKFSKGDEISLMDLLKASLICSHNNATIALAEYV